MYCTPSQVRELIPIIDESTMNDTQMSVYIKRAENYINGKLRDTYIVPFQTVPALIGDLTAEYSAYLVLRTIYSSQSPNSHEMVQALKENAEHILEELSKGELQLDAPQYSGIESTTEKDDKVFTLKDITPVITRY